MTYILLVMAVVILWELRTQRPKGTANAVVPLQADAKPPLPSLSVGAARGPGNAAPTVDQTSAAAAAATATATRPGAPLEEVPTILPVAISITHVRKTDSILAFLSSTSAKPMSVDVQVLNPDTLSMASKRLELAPYETEELGAQDSLVMHPGDRLTLQSPPFPDRTEVVP